MKKKPYILIIDSGLGGLHILAKARKLCPTTNFLYIADDNNLPYGNKSPNKILNSIIAIYNRFRSCYQINAIVLACNTATAATIDKLRLIITIPIIGTEPNIRAALSMNYQRILTLATPLTVTLPRYLRLTTSKTSALTCPNLAQDIERALMHNVAIDLNDIIKQITAKNADSIVLGCTHYNFIADKLKLLNLPIFDSIDGVAKQIRRVASALQSGTGNTIILCTSMDSKKQNKYISYYKELCNK